MKSMVISDEIHIELKELKKDLKEKSMDSLLKKLTAEYKNNRK